MKSVLLGLSLLFMCNVVHACDPGHFCISTQNPPDGSSAPPLTFGTESDIPVAVTPEPGTWIMLLTGAAGLAWKIKRRS